eukprot:Em0023g144a
MAANPVNTPGRFDTLRTSLGKKDLRKKERMICKMNKEMLKLQKNFKEFHHTIRKKLSCKRVSFVNVQSSLQYLPCFKNTADLQCVLDHNTAIGKAKNMHDLFSAVLAYSSWYNYQLIALLAINFGGKGAKSIVQSYEARLQDHLLRPVPHCPPFWPATDGDALPNQEIPEGFTKMEVVVKRSYETCTLRDINILKNALSELLQLHQEAMILGSIQPGEEEQCHMTWMVPSVAMQHTINIAITRMSQLGASQIQQLRIGSTTIVTAPRPGQSASQPGTSCFSSGPQRSMSVDSTFTDGLGTATMSERTDSHHKPVTSDPLQRTALDSGRGTISPTTPQFSMNEEAYPVVTSSSTLSGGCGGHRGSGTFSPRLNQQQWFGEYATIGPHTPHQSHPKPHQCCGGGRELRPGCKAAVGTTSSRGAGSSIDVSAVRGGKVLSLPRTYHTWTRADNDTHGMARVDGVSGDNIDAEASTFGIPGSSSYSVHLPVSDAESTLPIQKPHTPTSKVQQLQSTSAKLLHTTPNPLSTKSQSSENSLPPPLPTPTTARTHHFSTPPSLHLSHTHWVEALGSSEVVPPPAMFSDGASMHEDLQLSGPYDSLRPLYNDDTLHRARSESIFDEGTLSASTTPLHCPINDPHQNEVKSPPQSAVSPTGAKSPPQSAASPTGAKSPPQSAVSPNEVKSPPQSAASPTGAKSPPQSATPRPTSFGISDVSKLLNSSNYHHDTPSSETNRVGLPHLPFPVISECGASLKPDRGTSSFLWRVLARASEQWPANVFIVTIGSNASNRSGSLKVGKGRKLMAMHRIGEQVYAIDCHGNKGFVPYSICRLSLKHYRHTEAQKLAHTNLYLQSADGVDDISRNRSHVQSLPVIRMVAIQEHTAEHQGTLSASVGDKLRALYCDEQWIYAINQTGHTGFLPRTACRLTRKGQEIFKDWIIPQRLFQSDFVVKFNEPVPSVLLRKQAATMPTFKQGEFIVIEDNYISKESSTTEPVFLKKGMRVRLLEVKGSSLRVTTGPGVSCWAPAQFCTPCRSSRPSSACSRSRSPGSRSRTASPYGSPLHAAVPPSYVHHHQPTSTAQQPSAQGATSRDLQRHVPVYSATSRGSLHCTPVDSMASRGSMCDASVADAATLRGPLHCPPVDTKLSGLAHPHAQKPSERNLSSHRLPSNCEWTTNMSSDSVTQLMPSSSLQAKVLSPLLHNRASPNPTRKARSPIPPVTQASPFTSNSRLYPASSMTNKRASHVTPRNGLSPIPPSQRLLSVPFRNGISPDPYSKRASPHLLRKGVSPDPYSKRASPHLLRKGVSPDPYSKRASPHLLRKGVSPDPYSKRTSPLPQWTGMTPGVSPTHSGVYHHREPSNRRSWGAQSSGSRGGLSIGSRGDNSRRSPSQRSESFI